MAPPHSVPQPILDLLVPMYRRVVAYHDYRVIGLHHIPTHGAALIVFTHSLATYDVFLLGATLLLEKKRLIVSLADRLIFKTPLLAEVARFLSAVPGDPTEARKLLDQGRLLGVAPGGMREALRPSTHRYTLDWNKRTGFAKLALEAQAPVVLAACPRADDLYDVYDNAITRFVYERFRFPLPLARGRGLFPRKVPLVHMVSEPITPPRIAGPSATREESAAFAAALQARMERLIEAALSAEKSTGV